MEFQGVKVHWLGHDCFKIRDGAIVYIDPFKIAGVQEPGDILLVTHEHFDHCNADDAKKVTSEKTTVVTIPPCKNELAKLKVKEVKTVKPGDKLTVGNVSIEAVAAYNLNKFREPGKPFHPKDDADVGYVLTIGGVRIYHTGDSDFTPEMRNVKADIAFLPVSGTYVMTAEEAAEAAKAIRPKVAVPMHYGAIVGSEADANRFAKLVAGVCEVKILNKE